MPRVFPSGEYQCGYEYKRGFLLTMSGTLSSPLVIDTSAESSSKEEEAAGTSPLKVNNHSTIGKQQLT